MKVGIITFHFAGNQGAALQCYALQTYLEKRGHAVQVINYCPPYHANKYAAKKNPFLSARTVWRKNSSRNLLRRAAASAKGFASGVRHTLRGTDKVRFQRFAEFTGKHLHQTDIYRSVAQLRKNPPDADVYISGSDQLWNPELTDCRFEEAYFLRFGPGQTKRLTYAISLKEHYSDAEKRKLERLCSDLDGICIRETNADLASCVQQDIAVCVDPTLLLDAADYAQAESQLQVTEPYLFVYGFETNDTINAAVSKIAAEKGLKVINGAPNRIRLHCPCEKVYDFGPGEFLAYIKNAAYVVTSSFHGTAFSLIYEKQFSVIAHSTRGKRMTELLQKLDLLDRIWHEDAGSWQDEIDYSCVRQQLHQLRSTTHQYFETHSI